jgi:hypothetical protein
MSLEIAMSVTELHHSSEARQPMAAQDIGVCVDSVLAMFGRQA